MTFIQEIATYLANNAVGTLGTTVFYSHLPDASNQCVAVFDTGGTIPDRYINTKSPTFQVFVRAATYTAGRELLDTIRTLLHNQYNVQLTVGGVYCYSINALSEGGHIGQNERGLDEFSMNFQALIR